MHSCMPTIPYISFIHISTCKQASWQRRHRQQRHRELLNSPPLHSGGLSQKSARACRAIQFFSPKTTKLTLMIFFSYFYYNKLNSSIEQ